MALLTRNTPKTILVVDDVPGVLKLVVSILRSADYVVLEALDGVKAIELASSHLGAIDLLLSDIEMPGLTGPVLGEIIKKSRPDIHIMLMSGLADGNLLVLNYGWAFLDKPFVPAKLLEMVENVLAHPSRSQGSHHYDTRGDPLQHEEGVGEIKQGPE